VRICMMSEDFLPNQGGVASHVYFLARELVRMGHDVILVVAHLPGAEALGPLDRYDGIPTLCRFPFPQTQKLIAWRWRTLRKVALLRWLHLRKPIDIIHTHTFEDLGHARRPFGIGAPARVFTNHTSMFLRAAASEHERVGLAERLRAAHLTIAPSPELCDVTVGLVIDGGKVVYIPNGVDCQAFQPPQGGRTSGLVVATRRLVNKNGVDLLIRAWPRVLAAVPTARLVLVGDGEEHGLLKELSHGLGVADSVTFRGSLPRDEIPSLYQQATLCVVPSRMEAVSISALEAMASGLPVVATRVGGLPEIVRPGETGVLVEPESPEDLGRGIIEVLTMRDRGAALGQRARGMVEREYSWSHIAALTLEAYERALQIADARCRG